MLVAFVSDQGDRRANQDNAVVDMRQGLYAVLDGVGGGDSGELASALAAGIFRYEVCRRGADLEQAVQTAHEALVDFGTESGVESYCATTIAALHDTSHGILSIWAGDSRIYRLSNGHFEQVSADHADADGALTQALGHPSLASISSDTAHHASSPGTRWLICSDGLFRGLGPADLAALLGADLDVGQITESLLRAALDADPGDNITLIVLEEEDSPPVLGTEDEEAPLHAHRDSEPARPRSPLDWLWSLGMGRSE
ncbi:PP2C family protein-serine/threonine phosphatase [Allohahella marinimesophila]|uniref:Protein phosphatase 2C domain-containing protein n=1 Tax=Allohahella marinimesophila TaxID=1054972 RepID=A0ABP7PD46_9GAMM